MLYVLDLDDTLYLEVDYVRSGFQAVDSWFSEHYGSSGLFDIAWTLFQNGQRGKTFDRALSEMGVKDYERWIPCLVEVYRSHQPEIELAADAERFLACHSDDDLALITDGAAKSQRAKIEALDLTNYIEKVIVTDEWRREYWKPHPRAYDQAQNGRRPQDCVFIGDNPRKDFEVPLRRGWQKVYRIRRPRSLHEDLPTPAGVTEIFSLDEIDREIA